MNYRYLVSFKIIRDKHSRQTTSWFENNFNLISPRPARTHLILGVGMIRGLADVPPHLLKNPRRLVQGFRVEERLPIKVQRILLVIEAERQAQDQIQGRCVVVVAARVPVQRLLVQLAAVRLSSWKGNGERERMSFN